MRTLLTTIFLPLLISCSSYETRKEIAYDFGWLDNRTIPVDILDFKRMDNYIVGFQPEEKVTSDYNYPNYYVIGVLDGNSDNLKYTTKLINYSPFENWEYVKSIIEHYQSDTTYVDRIGKTETVNVLLYRQVTSPPSDQNFPEHIMWKWLSSENQNLDFEVKEVMNEHLFK